MSSGYIMCCPITKNISLSAVKDTGKALVPFHAWKCAGTSSGVGIHKVPGFVHYDR